MNYTLRLNDNRLYYLLAIAFITDYLQYLFDPFHYISYICEFFICIIMLPYFFRLKRHTLIFYLILYYFIFLIFRGLFYGNFYKYIIFDIHIYTSIVFLTYFNNSLLLNRFYSKLPELFAKLLIISSPIVFFTFFLFGAFNLDDPHARSFLKDQDSNLNSSMFLAPIMIAPLLVPFVKELKRSLKYIVLLANALIFIYGMLTASRGLVVISILSYLSLITWQRIFKKSTIFLILLLSVFIAVVSISKGNINSLISSKFDYTIARFVMEDNFATGRETEVAGLFDEFSRSELIFGRGSGAEQKFGFWKDSPAPGEHGINFAHFGFLHLILKGGFILLIFVYGLALYSLIVLYHHGEKKYFFVILIYLTAELSHTQFINYFYLIFLWASISLALRLTINNKKSQIIIPKLQ